MNEFTDKGKEEACYFPNVPAVKRGENILAVCPDLREEKSI